MKNKLMLIPLSLAILGIGFILFGQFGTDIGNWLTSWSYYYLLGVPAGILAIALIILLFRYRGKKPASSATTPTPATTATATTPASTKKPEKEPDPELGWAIFGLVSLIIIVGGVGTGIYLLANFVLTQVRTDAPFIQNIPKVRVINPLPIGHDAAPAPKPTKPRPRAIEFILSPGQSYKVAEMLLGEYCVFQAAEKPFSARIRRTDQTEFTPLGTDRIGTKWRATWDGTLEVKSDTRNKITVIIIP